MKLYKEGYLFKPFLRNSKKYRNYYNSLISSFKMPKLYKSQSENYFNITRKKGSNDEYKSNDNDNDNNNQSSKIKENYISPIKLFKRTLNHKIEKNSKIRNQMIYKDMIYNGNSSLLINFRNNIKKIKIKSRSYLSNSDKSSMSCIINFFNDYEKEFFPDIDYSNLKYNDYEIYKDKKVYENLIKEKVNYFKNNKNLNPTIKFQKNFFYGKFRKEIDLTFNSLKITFKDMAELKDNNSNNNFEFTLPFSLLPIFYFKGFEAFIKFLSIVIKVENNFEKVIFEEDKISDALNDLKDYKIKNDIEKVKSLELKSIFKKSLKKEMPKQIRPLILKKEKNFSKYNNFVFFWITNTKTFIVTITLPSLDLQIIENKILIHHFVDYEFLFYLYKRNFLNWDYFVIRNLSGYSKFRNIFQKLGSAANLSSQNIFLKEPKTFQNNFGEEILFNVYTDHFNKNQIIQFKSFFVIVNLIDLTYKLEKTYQIYFNFFHYLKLYEIAKYSSKIIFLFKFLEINSDTNTLSFNFKEFDEFDIKNWMENIKKFSSESLQKRNNQIEKLSREFEFFAKKIKIEFIRPKWSIIRLENHNEIIKTWEVGEDLEKDLVDSINYPNSNCWTNFLNGCLKKLNEPVPILPEIKMKQKFRKRGYSGNFSSSSSERRSKTRYSKV